MLAAVRCGAHPIDDLFDKGAQALRTDRLRSGSVGPVQFFVRFAFLFGIAGEHEGEEPVWPVDWRDVVGDFVTGRWGGDDIAAVTADIDAIGEFGLAVAHAWGVDEAIVEAAATGACDVRCRKGRYVFPVHAAGVDVDVKNIEA